MRVVTTAIRERNSRRIVDYAEHQNLKSPVENAWDRFDAYFETVKDTAPRGSKMEFYLYLKSPPTCSACRIDVTVIFEEQKWEKTYPGFPIFDESGSCPYQIQSTVPRTLQTGKFPACSGPEDATATEDEVLDEVMSDDGIYAQMRSGIGVLKAAVDRSFDAESAEAVRVLLSTLRNIIGATGDVPPSDCRLGNSAEGLLMNLYDGIHALWLGSNNAQTLPDAMKADHLNRLDGDPDHQRSVREFVSNLWRF